MNEEETIPLSKAVDIIAEDNEFEFDPGYWNVEEIIKNYSQNYGLR
jgi:hypothetical protein